MRAFVVGVLAPACAAAVVAAGNPAVAAVAFDPQTGHGFAGRKDVRAAFGWTTAELRERARALSFAYVDRKLYAVACNGSGQSAEIEAHEAHEKQVRDRVRRVGRAVLGFDLLGYRGETSSTDRFQQEGEPCTGWDDGPFPGVWGPAEQISATKGLVVRYKGEEHLLT